MKGLTEGLLTLLAITIVIFALLIPKSVRNLSFVSTGEVITGGSTTAEVKKASRSSTSGITQGQSLQSQTSPRANSIQIHTGNASYSYEPYEEYITIENRGTSNVDITGWRLENGKNTHAYPLGDKYVYYLSDSGIIPQATRILVPNGSSVLEDVVLKPGERAIVVTGSPQNISPYKIISFKENSCIPYLTETYQFPSGMEKGCVLPQKEPGVSSLDLSCQRYINSMRSCHTPKYESVDRNGDLCTNCVDGKEGLPSMCIAFIKSHYSYPGCLAYHMGDTNFEGRVWHVYLYRPWEMWAKDNETISLYDRNGLLQASAKY